MYHTACIYIIQYLHVNCIDSLCYLFLAMVYMVFPSEMFINMNPNKFNSLYSLKMFIINMQEHAICHTFPYLAKSMYLVFDGFTESWFALNQSFRVYKSVFTLSYMVCRLSPVE